MWRGILAIGRFLAAARCLLCGATGQGGVDLCAGCAASLPVNDHQCGRCALPLAPSALVCTDCTRVDPPWHTPWVPFRYAWPLDVLEARFKFGGDLVSGKVLSHRWIAAAAPRDLPEAIVPVPLHVSRLRERGFNQAHELARPLARDLGIPLRPGWLERTRRTDAQSDLDAEGRAGNVRGAFVARVPSGIRHVAVVDDVMTTGATLAACTLALKRGGVERVDVWALARTPKPSFKDGEAM